MKVLLPPTPEFRRQYRGGRAPNGLREIADVKLHESAKATQLSARRPIVAAISEGEAPAGAVNEEHWTRRP